MITPQRHKLIDGTFNAQEAAQVLLSLVNRKIEFHECEKLSHEERFGQDLKHSERRLAELRQLHEVLREVCQSAAENGQALKINGWIEVTLVPDPPLEPVGAASDSWRR